MLYWQSIFNRAANKNHEDLIEDVKCIGFMEKINGELDKDENEKTTKIVTYKFVDQDFKIKEKDSVLDATDGNLDTYAVGQVLSIDESKRNENIIEILPSKVKGTSEYKDLPKYLSIVKNDFFPHTVIIDAIRRFVKSAVKGEKNIRQRTKS